ncbi:hypothetical protein EJB05_12822 [Eragrostis curvula]|uniref:Uncharacterized protein n=1 Tax=Eragrostis curvula TaxID=38414 RepID=A0A5J9VUZ7_9POAL|nr:hypothetical protein EJB05_12822 [Eragrostis curvula]
MVPKRSVLLSAMRQRRSVLLSAIATIRSSQHWLDWRGRFSIVLGPSDAHGTKPPASYLQQQTWSMSLVIMVDYQQKNLYLFRF